VEEKSIRTKFKEYIVGIFFGEVEKKKTHNKTKLTT
jgi:hypothetical protein